LALASGMQSAIRVLQYRGGARCGQRMLERDTDSVRSAAAEAAGAKPGPSFLSIKFQRGPLKHMRPCFSSATKTRFSWRTLLRGYGRRPNCAATAPRLARQSVEVRLYSWWISLPIGDNPFLLPCDAQKHFNGWEIALQQDDSSRVEKPTQKF